MPCFAKPLFLVNKDEETLTLKSILTDFLSGYDFDVVFKKGKRGVITYFQHHRLFRRLSDYERRRFILRTIDREQLNNALGLSCKEYFLTHPDLDRIEEIVNSGFDGFENTNWKVLDSMRLCTFGDMISAVITMNIPKCIVHFKTRGVVYPNVLNRACAAYMLESSQCQLDTTETEVAKKDLRHKIALPIHQFDGVEAGMPHPSWIGFIDSLNTPQSHQCGAVVHRCDGTTIVDGKLVRTTEDIYSPLMGRAVTFPQFLMAHRQVMCSAIAKQCCTLGENSKFEENQVVRTADSAFSPLHGRNVLLGLMDWNLYTHEDACVISDELAAKLVTKKEVTTTFFDAVGDMSLGVKEGDKVRTKAVAGLFSDGQETLVLQNRIPGIITKIEKFDHEIEEQKVKCVRITVECEYACTVGSKLSNLHSCKSIVSKILPAERMPVMANGDRVEMMISPMNVGKRGNPSLLLEGMLGMHCRKMNEDMEFEPFVTETLHHNQQKKMFEWAAELLKEIGYPEDCMFRLKNGNEGKFFENRTFVGYIFLMRLHFHADEKLIFQNKLIMDPKGLAVRGRGNTKYGREELEILYQHEAENIISEMQEVTKRTDIGAAIAGLVRTMGYQYIK